ncbi:short-chain dehydrogenase/reductase SDR [Punctularia strigosozonata HHB-11173 SS5]|uniref:short-chain dehydrogenase/reductase SDR n=1 Tax=Punctularia strigosozonata (strain HHB-11173) TaxID=741275 RepID=UPI0004417958|nr:short-chain dehydrogenase/reductase SDR [Punctularia strigosozonata HHB-11173 SS5]EIN12398.1 short-chain dehydrogenase/reductase SDR [Punctularia strigosozonata HHB-11173 SS5]
MTATFASAGLQRKIAIVTGASSGIGRATAIALAGAGWTLMLTARREAELAETAKLARAISTISGVETIYLEGDITDETFVRKLFDDTVAQFGRVDLLFNNAGIIAPQVPIDELPVSAFKSVINVNLIAAFMCTREAFRVMKAQNPSGGRIINNGSLSAHVPRPHTAPYTISKHAITGLTKSTSLDGRSHGIACTQIDIGPTRTELAAGIDVGALQANGSVVAEPMIDVRNVADSIVHIASLPTDVTVLTFNIMPTTSPFVGRG